MQRQEGGLSMTECNAEQLEFHALGKRVGVGKFDGGTHESGLDLQQFSPN